jgi:ketosteroid isomerase-like protein
VHRHNVVSDSHIYANTLPLSLSLILSTFGENGKWLILEAINDQTTVHAFLTLNWKPAATNVPLYQVPAVSGPALDPQRMVNLSKQLYAHWGSQNMQGVLDLVHDNVEVQICMPGAKKNVAWQGTWHGKKGVVDMLTALQSETIVTAVPEITIPLTGNRTFTLLRANFTGRESKKMVSLVVLQIHTFATDFKIVRYEDWFDTGTIRAVINGMYLNGYIYYALFICT